MSCGDTKKEQLVLGILWTGLNRGWGLGVVVELLSLFAFLKKLLTLRARLNTGMLNSDFAQDGPHK